MDIFQFSDEIGPRKVIGLYEPKSNLRAILVVDNVACGPAIGGVRMAPDVTLAECFRLARAMTFKNAAAGLPHGGGKSVIVADPAMPRPNKEELIRAFARSIEQVTDYIVGPDMGTNELCMGWVYDEIQRAVGLPREIGGIPLDEIGATGFGLSIAAQELEGFYDLDLKSARIAIQGFGAVGYHAARFLAQQGAKLVAASDSQGCVIDQNGLDIDELAAIKQRGGQVRDSGANQKKGRDDIVDVDCDIWIPAARPDVISMENVARLKTRFILQGANIPITIDAEKWLHDRGIISIPDFIANAGGVICAAVEYQRGSEKSAFDAIADKISRNTRETLRLVKDEQLLPREAAEKMALNRLKKAMMLRRSFG